MEFKIERINRKISEYSDIKKSISEKDEVRILSQIAKIEPFQCCDPTQIYISYMAIFKVMKSKRKIKKEKDSNYNSNFLENYDDKKFIKNLACLNKEGNSYRVLSSKISKQIDCFYSLLISYKTLLEYLNKFSDIKNITIKDESNTLKLAR